MEIIKKIVAKVAGNGVETLVKTVSDTVDKFVQTPDEKAAVENTVREAILAFQANTEKELTERLRIDMNSDSWLSKNIRPLTLVFLSIVITVLCVLDSSEFGFKVKDIWVDLFKWAWMSVLAFYFVGREITKNIRQKKSNKENK